MKLNLNVEEFRRSELLEKYTAKILFGWDNRKFKNKYLKKLEKLSKIEERKVGLSFFREGILFSLFFILDLNKGCDITSHITVTHKSQSSHICHSHRLHNYIT